MNRGARPGSGPVLGFSGPWSAQAAGAWEPGLAGQDLRTRTFLAASAGETVDQGGEALAGHLQPGREAGLEAELDVEPAAAKFG